MNFLDALKYSYENRTNTEEFANPFFLYCKLSDLCGSGYEDKRKVALFYQVNKKLNIVRAVLQGDESVERKYQEVADIISENNFQKLMEAVKNVVCRERKEEEKAELQTQEAVGGNCAVAWLSVIFGLIIALGAVALFTFIFRWTWTSWQWLIGIGGGMLLFAIVSAITIRLNEEFVAACYIFDSVALGISILTNFVLLLIFKSDYKIIFYTLSAFELIGGAILVPLAFNDMEEACGLVQTIEIIVTVALFIITIIWI